MSELHISAIAARRWVTAALKSANRRKHSPPGAGSDFALHSSTAGDRRLPFFAGVA